MTTRLRHERLVSTLAVTALLWACGGEDTERDPEPDASADTTVVADVGTDGDVLDDDTSGTDDTSSADDTTDDVVEDTGPMCADACAETSLTADFGGADLTFERAFFGLTPPEEADESAWTLHIEVNRGGLATCPQEEDPTPDQTLVLGAIPLPDAPAGGSASLLDYEGALLTGGSPYAPATDFEITWGVTDFETDLSTAQLDAYLSFDLEATFEDGTLSGHVYAVHCPSMDL